MLELDGSQPPKYERGDTLREYWEKQNLWRLRRDMAKIEAVDGLPEALLAKLTKQQERLIQYLWKHPQTTVERLQDAVWGGRIVQPEAVVKALYRLNERLVVAREFGTEVKVKGRQVRLIRPDTT